MKNKLVFDLIEKYGDSFYILNSKQFRKNYAMMPFCADPLWKSPRY